MNYPILDVLDIVKEKTGKTISRERLSQFARSEKLSKFGKSYIFTNKDIDLFISRMGQRGNSAHPQKDNIIKDLNRGKMSQQQIADKYNIDQSTVYNYSVRIKNNEK